MSELILVSVPGVEFDDEGAKLAVLMVPRLTGPGTTLDDYGMTDWPAVVANAQLEIHLRSSAGADQSPVTAPVSSGGQSEAWREFFGRIEVRPFTGQRTYDPPIVEPTTDQVRQIDDAYREATTSVGDPDVVRQQYDAMDLGEPAPAPALETAVPEWVPPDFHRSLALLREHPRVLRALGLIVDVRVPRAALTPLGKAGEVSVRWPGAPQGIGTVVSPRTAYSIDRDGFLPASTRTIVGGLVDLRTKTRVTTVDPDTGAASSKDAADWLVRTVDVSSAVARLSDAKVALAAGAKSEPATLPALRTAGLLLMHRGRGEALAARTERAAGNAGLPSLEDGPALTADDLVLGYRLDVRRPGRDWFSLNERVATYKVGNHTLDGGAQPEEGHIKPVTGVLGTDGVLRTDETVARWSGWSLAVPRPSLDPTGLGQSRVPPAVKRPMPYDFSWDFTLDDAEPAVPELRFGRSYQLRARVVDIAGGGLAVSERTGDVGSSEVVSYGRYEPLAPPEIPPPPGLLTVENGEATVHHELLGPGGSMDVLVVRSDPRGDGDDVVSPYPPNDTRTLLPPAATFSLAEGHDRLNGTDEQTWRNVRRAVSEPRSSAEPRNGRQYTWLPDPAVQGVALVATVWTADVGATPVALRAWGGAGGEWPDFAPKSLTVRAADLGEDTSVDWSSSTTADVLIGPGQQVSLEVSSSLEDDFLDRFAAGAFLSSDDVAGGAVYSGRHPVVTPPRTLHVVHAVRRPLAKPAANLSATRTPGATFAEIGDSLAPLLGVDRDSTAQVEVRAAWDDWADNPEPQPVQEVVQTVPVGLAAARLDTIRHEFADTKRREINYELTARSRFRDYFAAQDADSAFVSAATFAVHVPSTARPPVPEVLSVVPAFQWEESDDGTTLTRVRGGARLRLELGGPWYATGFGEQLGVIVAPAFATIWVEGAPDGGTVGTEPTQDAWNLFTTLYRDPLFTSGVPQSQPDHSLMVEHTGVAVVQDLESLAQLVVAPYDVWFSGGRRFADIAFTEELTATYCPLIRLTIARFQGGSLPGLGLSPLVKLDAVPLLPTRTLTVFDSPFGPQVMLSGLGPDDQSNRVEVRLEARPRVAGDAGPAGAGSGPSGDLTTVGKDLGLGGWAAVSVTSGSLNTAMDPITVPGDGRVFRLVIREVEALPVATAPATTLAADDPLAGALRLRTVFADVVPVRPPPV